MGFALYRRLSVYQNEGSMCLIPGIVFIALLLLFPLFFIQHLFLKNSLFAAFSVNISCLDE